MLNKTKLLYITHSIQIGGVEVALISGIPALFEKYDLTVLVLGTVDQKMVSHLTEPQKACIHAFDYPLWSYPVTLFKVLRFIGRIRPDVMISSLWRASMVGTLAKRRWPNIRFISFVHSSTFFHKLDKMFTVSALKHSDYIFTDCSATSEFVEKEYAPDRNIAVISFFTQKSPDHKSNPPLTKLEARFMFLGRLSQVKNLNLAADTIKYLRDRGIDAKLDLYGREDGALQSLNEQIKAHQLENVIKYEGGLNIAQKQKAFQQYHFLIQLSSNEGMAMSVAEAMQNGLVCFVTPVGEIRHYAGDMDTALFADIWDPEKWRQSLEKLENCIRNPDIYQQISANSFRHFQRVELYSESLCKTIDYVFVKEQDDFQPQKRVKVTG
ncbi:hypothetical protein GCM10010967_02240 [Dyadobacter beijingensis]|uniref:Uncharacterized protein n=1 Tax=Dyadobacter beijingensis TaxID=365489 RepID=A0ABQ2HCS8_9BACT|nr:glycosyltransferase family 4 protein [Dyadobacter beijingensis]GGM74241.1 hypothetical protein GCM10010967_02240 [Dyadobacter beijingensis]